MNTPTKFKLSDKLHPWRRWRSATNRDTCEGRLSTHVWNLDAVSYTDANGNRVVVGEGSDS